MDGTVDAEPTDPVSTEEVATAHPWYHQMNLREELVSEIQACGLSESDVLQRRALNLMLTGRSVILVTDSDKGAAAISIALLQRLEADKNSLQVLVLAATKERADEIHQTIAKLGERLKVKCISCSSEAEFDEAFTIDKEGFHVLVSTPDCALGLIHEEMLIVGDVKTFVLDEAVNLLTFSEQVLDVRRSLPTELQVIVASSTFSEEVKQFASEMASNAKWVNSEPEENEAETEEVVLDVKPDLESDEKVTEEELNLLVENEDVKSAVEENGESDPSIEELPLVEEPSQVEEPEKPADTSGSGEDIQLLEDKNAEPDDADIPEPFEEEEEKENVPEDKKVADEAALNKEVKAIWEEILEDSELTTGDEMDLTKTLEPLGYSLTNREELLNQVLSTVKGVLFSTIMPEFLKELHSDYVKRLFLRELKQMDTGEIRNILRGGDFIVTPDLLPAFPARSLVPVERKEPEEAAKPEPAEVDEVVKPEAMEEDDDGFRPYPKKKKEDDESDDNLIVPKPLATPTGSNEPSFKGTDDDEKKRLEEALAELEAKEAEAAAQAKEEEEEENRAMEQRRAVLENEVRVGIDRLNAKMDELDNDAEKLQAEGYQEMLEADAKDASDKLEAIEKTLMETQEEVNRLKSTVQAQIDAGVRMMSLNAKYVGYMKEIHEIIARGRTLSRLLSPMRRETDRALSKTVRGLDDDADSRGPVSSGNGPPSGFQPVSGFMPVVSDAQQQNQEPAATTTNEENQDGRASLTWSARWVSSEKVQKVLTHSKVFSRVRQKMGGVRHQRINIETGDRQFGEASPGGGQGTQQQQTPQAPDVFQSVDEYRKFFRSLPETGKPEDKQQQQQQQQQQQKLPPSFDTKKLVSLADQVKQAMESGGFKGMGKEAPMGPPPGWPPRPESYYPPPHYAGGPPPGLRPPGTDVPRTGAPPPGFPPGMPPPHYPPPTTGAPPPFMDMPPPPWGVPPPTVPTSTASGPPLQGVPTGVPPPGHPPPGMWDNMFSQPPPATPGQPLPWQQQQQQHHQHHQQQQQQQQHPGGMPPHWPQQMGAAGQMDQSQQGARHWPPLRPEDYDQHQQHYAYPEMQYGAQPSAAALLGSPLTTSDEEGESAKKKKKKHKKEKKKRKKEKKEKKKSKRKSKDDDDDDELEEGEEEDEVMAVGEAQKAASKVNKPSKSTVDLDGDEEGEIRDDEENLWAKIMGD